MKEQGIGEKEVQIRRLEIDNSQFKQEAKSLGKLVDSLQSKNSEVESQLDHLRRQLDLVNQDKAFLSREKVIVDEQVKKL